MEGDLRSRRKTCPTVILFTMNITWNVLGAKPSLRGENPATNCLSHDTVMRDSNDKSLFTYIESLTYFCEPGSSVSTASGYGMDDRAIEVRSPAEAKGFFL
jgi:hypothetical protein